jgi:hypothetical protein
MITAPSHAPETSSEQNATEAPRKPTTVP